MNFQKKNGILFVAPVRFLYRRDAEEDEKGQIYMNKSVFIAEKPSVAQEFAKALKVKTTRHDGYLESENTIVTWCVGHLVTMSYRKFMISSTSAGLWKLCLFCPGVQV